jgi:hypothetical protein
MTTKQQWPARAGARGDKLARWARTVRVRAGAAALGAMIPLALAACGGGGDATGPKTPRTAVPEELTGTWLTGTVSLTEFNESGANWESGYGSGLFYTFHADGTFDYGWEEYAGAYGCQTRALVVKSGTVAVDEASHTIHVYPTSSRVYGEDECNPSNDYQRRGPTDEETLIWDWEQDEYGNVYLDLRYPNTNFSAFHRP